MSNNKCITLKPINTPQWTHEGVKTSPPSSGRGGRWLPYRRSMYKVEYMLWRIRLCAVTRGSTCLSRPFIYLMAELRIGLSVGLLFLVHLSGLLQLQLWLLELSSQTLLLQINRNKRSYSDQKSNWRASRIDQQYLKKKTTLGFGDSQMH